MKYEEGAKLKQAETKDKVQLATMKTEMIKSLESKGIDPTYLAELRSLDISKIDRR